MTKSKNKKEKKASEKFLKESFETTALDLSFLHNLSGGQAVREIKKLTAAGVLDDGK